MNHPGNNLPAAFSLRMSGMLGGKFNEFCSSLAEPSPVSIRRHPFKYPIGYFEDCLNDVPWCGLGSYLAERPKFDFDPLWHAGAYYVQEASSMFLEQAFAFLDLPEGAIVLDACAAPGGKSTHLLSLLGNDSLLVSNELIPKRNLILRDNLDRWGFPNIVVSQNKTDVFSDLPHLFDLVVTDAPCSGEGLFRKDHKAMREWSPAHVEACSRRQEGILEDLVDSVRPGGYLIYSTCTYSKVENELRIAALLETGNWVQLELPVDPFDGLQRGLDGIGVRFYPHLIRGEGFFLACLQKKGKSPSPPTLPKQIKGNCPPSLDHWLKTEGLNYSEWNGNGYVFPAAHASNLQSLQKRLRITKAGIETGRFIHGSLKPSHSLALSILTNQDVPIISLTLEDSIKYLKKETIPYRKHYQSGWNLVQYQGVSLGWSKVLDRRINNYYPKSLSIRP